MAQTNIIPSVSSVPFRRFLPHERQNNSASFKLNERQTADDDIDTQERNESKPVSGLLSNEDIGVLMQAGHPEDTYYAADAEYLPFTFALAATNH